MIIFKKGLPALLLALMIIGTGFGYRTSLADHPQQVEGTWLYLWWHGPATIKNTDGTFLTQLMFIPESYKETTDQKSESFLRFRADQTGSFFRRFVVFKSKNKKETVSVVTKGNGGEWVEEDKLETKTDFRWQINGHKLTIRDLSGGSQFNKAGQFEFIINVTPTRPASRELKSRLGLKNELIVYRLGQFLRVGNATEQGLLKRYLIP